MRSITLHLHSQIGSSVQLCPTGKPTRASLRLLHLTHPECVKAAFHRVTFAELPIFTAMFDTDIDEINLAARSRVEEMRQLVASLLGEGTDG